MKKIILTLVSCVATFNILLGQANLLIEAPQDNGSTTQVRAPNGLSSSAYMRACVLVLPSELVNIPIGTNITSFGFTLSPSTNVSIPVTGNFTVYLQNTSDLSYLKGTNFAAAITGMTSVYSNTMTIPLASTTPSIILTLSTPFTYTGGGIYVAYDWYSPGPYSTNPATYLAENLNLNPGTASGASATSPAPATLGLTNFRPAFLFGGVNSYTNEIQIIGVECPGKVPAVLNSPHTIKAIVKNASNITKTNVPVSLNVGGANVFTNTQNVASIIAGATATVNFSAFNPTLPGLNTVSVSVPVDDNNANNLATYAQSVTCETWALNPAIGSYTNGVGFNAVGGIIGNSYMNPVTSTLTGLRAAISTDPNAVGKQGYGVLFSSGGIIMATTNTLTITNGMLGSFQNFNFPLFQSLTANTQYYLGFAQPASATAYLPLGTVPSAYIAANAYVTSALGGGVLTPLNANLGYFGIEGVFAHSVTVSANSQSIICGNTATINALSTANYSWSTGATTSSIAVSPTVNLSYTVVASNSLGCTASAIANVSVNPITVSVTSSSTTICAGTQINITASGAVNYSWTNGATSPTIVDSPTTSIAYVVTGTNSAGCSASGFALITVNANPIISILSSTSAVCAGNAVTYTATGANSYNWDFGPTTSIVTLSPTASTIYTLIGTGTNGCTNTATVSITVNSFTLDVTPNATVCSGASVALNASGAFTYNWLIGNGYPFANTSVTPTTSTTYTIIGTDLFSCSITKTVEILVNPNPTLTTTASKTIICKGESSILTASGANSYSWTNVSTGSVVTTATLVFTPLASSNQTLLITGLDNNNCSTTNSITIKVNACLGVSENQNRENILTIFPNPNNGNFIVQLSNWTKTVHIEIYNSIGQLVTRLKLDSESTSVNLESLDNGIYFVNVMEGTHTKQVSKIIKQ